MPTTDTFPRRATECERRKMRRSRTGPREARALGLLLTGLTVPSLFCQPAPGFDNAALQYRRAYAAMHQAKATLLIPPGETAYTMPLDDSAAEAIRAAGPALGLVYSGVSSRQCDWGVRVEEGINPDTSHRSVVRDLSALLGVRARLRLAGRHYDEAVDDMLAGITLARHLSTDGSLASALIAAKLENEHAKLLALHMGKLKRSVLTRVLEGLETAPQGSLPRDALVSQITISHTQLTRIVTSATSDADLLRKLEMLPMAGSSSEELLRACGGTAASMIQAMSEVKAKLAEWVPRFDLPPPEFERAFLSETAQLKERNGVFRMLTPSYPRVQREDAVVRVQRVLLLAAVAITRDGTAALARYKDPYSAMPFLHSVNPEGFRLRSALVVDGRPVELIAGPPARH